MFRTRVFAAPDAFHVALEYGHAETPGNSSSTCSSKEKVRLPVSSARLELDWSSTEPEQQTVERFVRLQSNPPVLRSIHFTRASGSGNASETLVTSLLAHTDLSGIWKLRGCEGLGHFWTTCVQAPGEWRCLRSLNLSSCGLVVLPADVGQLGGLRVLRLNHNKLSSLPPELGMLTELEILSANHNQLATLPAELRRCCCLRELHLEHNRLVTPLMDLTHATALASLQLYGNPLDYLPELGPAVGLRSLSLANVRILADAAYSSAGIEEPAEAASGRWEVEVTAPSSSYTSMVIGARSHKLQPLFNLVFRRSNIQHPLLMGALSRLVEEPPNLELLVREDVALQQLVLAALGSNSLVVEQAVKVVAAAGSYAGAVRRLVRHNVVQAVTDLVASRDMVRCAALHALGNSAFDVHNRRRYLQSPGLMQLLVSLAAPSERQNEQVRIALGQSPIRGRGLRVLAMDGGGMKGMAMVELLRQLERRAGAPIWSLFDVIGGTSTGGLLAVATGILRLNLDECQDIYTKLGNKLRHAALPTSLVLPTCHTHARTASQEAGWRESLYRMYATGSANMRVAVYGAKHDAAPYEELLRLFCAVQELGCASDRLIDTAVLGGPKVFVVATLASERPAAPFAFRNYELPEEAAPAAAALAACGGSCKHHVWEAVRASSAAPYYLDDFLTPDGMRFQDGATTANNPAVVALAQARLLHPQLPIDVLVSLGCGAEPPAERSKGLSTVIDTGSVLLESACSVDRVHEALAATLPLVPGCQYYRFNPVDARCAMELDDIKPESWRKLTAATSEYCSKPDIAAQFEQLAALLTAGQAPADPQAAALGAAAAAAAASPRAPGSWLGYLFPWQAAGGVEQQEAAAAGAGVRRSSGTGDASPARDGAGGGAVGAAGTAAAELLSFLGLNPSSSSLGQLVASQGPLLPTPDGGMLAVLGQQQLLAPAPAAQHQPPPSYGSGAAGAGWLMQQQRSSESAEKPKADGDIGKDQAGGTGSGKQEEQDEEQQQQQPEEGKDTKTKPQEHASKADKAAGLLSRLNRLLVIGKKKLPNPAKHERYFAFVGMARDGSNNSLHPAMVPVHEATAATPKELTEGLTASTYDTKTRGQRKQGPARAAGEGSYVIAKGGSKGGAHLAYVLELPAQPGQAQRVLGVSAQGSFSLSEQQREQFQGRAWVGVEDRSLLDVAGTELLLVGAKDDPIGTGELGAASGMLQQASDEEALGLYWPISMDTLCLHVHMQLGFDVMNKAMS
ncbi:hypothetical protein COO60DRAFT_1457519 [Scenedesmus sp. NREL 46B-D3]|nr:hypothetical protein COO60DRAFT_1457519 [Scenedesmus sp. NREL 46B-D3]